MPRRVSMPRAGRNASKSGSDTVQRSEPEQHASDQTSDQAPLVEGQLNHPTAEPLRQSRIARLQRSVGNRQAAQRIQRNGGNQEFVPVISAKPPSANVLIGDTHTQIYEVDNARQAPRSTNFHWGGGLTSASDQLDFVDMNDQRGGRQTRMQVKGGAPGQTELEGNLVHQVPGGPEVITSGPRVPVTVPTPQISIVSMEKHPATGESDGNSERLSVGDQVVVRVILSNVSASKKDYGFSTVIGGQGHGSTLVSEGDVEMEQPGGFKVTFRANQVGNANIEMQFGPRNTPMEQAPKTNFATHVEMSRAQFLEQCNQVNTKIDLADRKSRAWMLSLAIAYGNAYKKHTDTLKAQDAAEKLVMDLVLGAALAFVPGGIGGVIGGAMKSAKSSDFMIDGIKDLAKWGLRTAGAKAGGAAGGGSGLQAFPEDPLQWRNQVELRITSEMAKATEQLDQWQTKARTSDPDFFLDFNPIEAMESGLKIQGQPAAGLTPVDQGQTAIDMEKGMWAKWLEMYGYELARRRVGREGDTHAYARENVGKKIKERCEAIGLDMTPYVEVARQRVQEQANQENRY